MIFSNKRILSAIIVVLLVLTIVPAGVVFGLGDGETADQVTETTVAETTVAAETTAPAETTETTEAAETTEATEAAETTEATQATEPAAQDPWLGKTVSFASSYPYLWSDPANVNSQTIVTASKFPVKMRVVESRAFSATVTLCKLESGDGTAWPEDCAIYVWAEAKYLKVVEEAPENTCKCCDTCTGKEGCLCGCDKCAFCEKEDTMLELKDAATGVTVTAETLPKGTKLSVASADVSSQLSTFGVPAAKKVFGLDISLQTAETSNYQPGEAVLVKVPVSAPVGTKIGILHTHNGKTTLLRVTGVLADGTVEFVTNRFSEFAGFTVDFHYNGVDYSIDGKTSILLSSLFTAMEINRQASDAVVVEFSDPSLVQVTRQSGDWLLTSLTAFDTNETLIITFANGDTVVISVTDDQSDGKTDDGDYRFTVFSKKITYLFWRSGGNDGTAHLHVMNEKGGQISETSEGLSHLASGGGNNFFYSGNTNAWYRIATENTGSSTQEGSGVRVQGKITTSTRRIRFYEYNRNLFINGVASKDYSGTFGAYLGSVRQNCGASVSTSTVDRTVVLKVQQADGTYSTIATETGIKFPDNSSLTQTLTITLKDNQKSKYDLILNGTNVGDSGYLSHSGGTYTIQLDLQAYTATAVAGTGISSTSGTGSYKNSLTSGTRPTFSATLAPGYQWTGDAGWYNGDTRVSTSQTYTFTMPIGNVTYTAKAVPIPYSITYNLVGGTVSPSNPDSYNVETATFALNNPTKSGYTFGGWTGSNGSTAQTNVSITKGSTGDKSYTATWNAVNYTANFVYGNGQANSALTYNADGTFTFPTTNSKQGYDFDGWTVTTAAGNWAAGGSYTGTSPTGKYGAVTFTAKWKERDDTPYTVKHYQQNAADNNYTEVTADRQTLTGTTGQSTNAVAKNYTGFTAQSFSQVTIAGDGSAVVSIYYNRNSYTVTVNKGTGVNSVTGGGTYKYGASVTINATLNTGYKWKNWTGHSTQTAQSYTFTMPAANVTYTANAEAAEVSYTVKHYQQNLADDDYTEVTADRQRLTGIFGQNTNAVAKNYAGFTAQAFSQTTIAADGTTVVSIYYNRNSYTVTVSAGTGISAVTGGGTYRYGASVTIQATLITGYSWQNWTGYNTQTAQSYTFSMPATAVAYTANGYMTPYTVTYRYINNAPAGVPAVPTAVTYYYGDAVRVAGEPTMNGYTFSGWTTSDVSVTDGAFTMPAGNVTLEGYWIATTYTATFQNANGEADTTVTYTIEKSISLPTPEKEGYIFDKWEVTDSGGNWVDGDTYTGSTPKGKYGDVSFTAQWKLEEYTISYDLAGGTPADGSPTSFNIEDAAVELLPPTRTGYTFAGWVGSNGTEPQLEVTIQAGSTGNKSYTATWTAYTYTVSFDGNGATSGTMEDQTFTYDAAQALRANAYALTRTVIFGAAGGETPVQSAEAIAQFNGWAETADGEVIYGDKETVSNLAQTQNARVTLYANWTPGSVTLPQPTLAGHRFLGWYTAAEGGEKVGDAGDSYVPDGSVTLYAQWERTTFTITFNTNGGSAMEPMSFYAGDTIPAITPPVKANARFVGWAPALPEVMPQQDLTVIALWEEAETLTITANGLPNETFLFSVKDTKGVVNMTVSVRGGSSVTIGGLYSDTYTVTELDSWSWSRASVPSQTVVISTQDGTTANKVQFTIPFIVTWWLHNENHN